LAEAGRYPLTKEEPLRKQLGDHHGIPAEHIILGNGSSEVIQMAVQALAGPGVKVVAPDPTFESIFAYASPLECEVERIPLTEAHAHDFEAMREATLTSPSGTLVYVCNPNNPTGTLSSCADLETWIEESPDNIWFLIDEAYHDFVSSPDYWSMEKWIGRRRNVIVTRTFSKVYGLAGLRIGYGLAHPEVAKRLREFASDININYLAIVAAEGALQDQAFVKKGLESNRTGLQMVCSCCDELGIEYIPSHTNFVMHRVKGELETHRERMAQRSIRVGRPFPPMLEFNRVSIGTPAEMSTFVATLREFRGKGWI
jgi:histidinol-phosphate aminotransferase